MTKREPRSPYQKYNKEPYRYSERYHKWRAAVKDGRADEAAALTAQYVSLYGRKS
jgi:hypothetical protein